MYTLLYSQIFLVLGMCPVDMELDSIEKPGQRFLNLKKCDKTKI
jgi:hypothetical protein